MDLIYYNSQVILYVFKHSMFHSDHKHIDIKFHFFKIYSMVSLVKIDVNDDLYDMINNNKHYI